MSISRAELLFLRRFALTLAALALALAALARPAAAAEAPAEGLVLAFGKAAMSIVIAPGASAQTQAVAAELADVLGRISGAPFEVVRGDGAAGGILLGTLAEFPHPELAEALEIRDGFDGKEAYTIRTRGDRLLLIGATDLGVSHAAFALLEALGYRQFFPAPQWEVVPSTPTLRVSLNRDDRPALLARRIWYGYGFFDRGPQSRVTRDYQAWSRRNRMGMSLVINCGHAWQTIISDNKAVFEQHPEYLALTGGKRQGGQLCVSNPGLRDLVIEHALNHFRRSPGADMVSVDPSDGGGHCECDECAKLGKVSNRVFFLANTVARAVAEAHPGKLVGLYAYNEHSEPPDFDLEPNVYVQLTAGFTRGQFTFDELLELWPQKCQNMGFYDYFSVWLWDFDRLPGGRGGNVAYLRRQIPRYVAARATSLDCESGNNWGPHGRGYYVANKLMWDPQADVDALLADFYDKAFGPAAAPMQRYYERFDPGNEPLMSEHLLALGFRDLEEASRLAADRPDVQARLDQLKQYLRYVHLRWVLDREKDPSRQKELTLATLTHVYRTRYSYMNHWEAMRQDWVPKAARQFEEPSWANESAAPWAVEEPYSREETEAAFREGLAYFQPQDVTEVTFSTNLLPVSLGGPAAVTHQYQGGARYAFYSTAGEPLSFGIVTGVIRHYRDRAATAYSVSDATGATVAEGRLPLDGETHAVEALVPRPGLYFLSVNDHGAGWGLRVEAGRPVSLALQRSGRLSHLGHMPPMHFYVPKGTRQLQYFWAGPPHWVHGPDGEKLAEVETNGGFVTLDVPAGADGKAWRFTRFAPGHLWFFNAPNVLAASPEALLLPQELAQKDGLAVRGR